MTALLTFLFTFVLIVGIVLYNSFSWGYVATIIYGWFVLPLFPQFPVFTWIQFAGIMFFINCFVHSGLTSSYLKKEVKDEVTGMITSIIAPWMTLLGAWIFKSFFL